MADPTRIRERADETESAEPAEETASAQTDSQSGGEDASHESDQTVTESGSDSTESVEGRNGSADEIPTYVRSELVDDGPASSVYTRTEDWVRANERDGANDGRSLTRTTFYDDADKPGPGQAHRDPDDRRSWQELAKWNDGMWSDKSRGGQNWAADKQRWIETLVGQLGLTDYHSARIEHIVDALRLRDYVTHGFSMEDLILAIATLVIDDEVTDWSDRALTRDSVLELGHNLELGDDDDAVVSALMDRRRRLKQKDSEVLFGNE